GDAIRVSLTEDSVHEIPVAQALADSCHPRPPSDGSPLSTLNSQLSYDPFTYRRRATERIVIGGVPLGGEETIRVFTSEAKWKALEHKLDKLGDYRPEAVVEQRGVLAVDRRDEATYAELAHAPQRF